MTTTSAPRLASARSWLRLMPRSRQTMRNPLNRSARMERATPQLSSGGSGSVHLVTGSLL